MVMVDVFSRPFPVETRAASDGAESGPAPESAASNPAPEHVRRHALQKLVRSDGTIDWSPWYLTEEEDMGQSGEQGRIIGVLHSSLQVLAEERGWSSMLVATDNFFAWVEGEPLVQVSPDIYLLDYPALSVPAPGSSGVENVVTGPDAASIPDADAASNIEAFSIAARMFEKPLPRRWELWRPEHPTPRLAIEIVSQDWKKDYDINPDRYDHLGVQELVLADPEAFLRDLSRAGRAPLLVYRRNAGGMLELAYRGHGPARCTAIDAFLAFQKTSEGAARVRISRDAAGSDIVSTSWEKTAAAEKRAAAEERIAAAEQKVAEADETIAAQAAEIAALRARLHGPDSE